MICSVPFKNKKTKNFVLHFAFPSVFGNFVAAIQNLTFTFTKMTQFPIDKFLQWQTPFYYYDLGLLRRTLQVINSHTADRPFAVHYAVKANNNPLILREIAAAGLGADVVSGGEIRAAVEAGFPPERIVYAGVGKTDAEIRYALETGIHNFNVESLPELEVINTLAAGMGTTAPVALRVNPDIDAHTHRYITTGTADNKFGIAIEDLPHAVDEARRLANIHLVGLHFHIGSQITQMQPFEMLCETVNRLLGDFARRGIRFETVNVGGGLGIDYEHPDGHPVADFDRYFGVFDSIRLDGGQSLHFELGRAVVAQCGTMVSRVLYVKESRNKCFAILDAGMNTLLRPALYQAHHSIQHLTPDTGRTKTYDIVGPICESTDVFARQECLPMLTRGDLVAFRSAGAYGESMASTYNLHPLPESHFS